VSSRDASPLLAGREDGAVNRARAVSAACGGVDGVDGGASTCGDVVTDGLPSLRLPLGSSTAAADVVGAAAGRCAVALRSGKGGRAGDEEAKCGAIRACNVVGSSSTSA
jgi:hypothetical protein